MAINEGRKKYLKGYATGRKFDRSLTLYCTATFALGVLFHFCITLIVF